MLNSLFVILTMIIVVQQVYFMRQIQKLVDKIMSRSYTEYITATSPPPIRVQTTNEIPEDLGPLKEFSL